MRGATILWALLAAIAGAGLFMLKYEVQAQEHRLAMLNKDIAGTETAIHVLKAEWSYLNDPERLKEMAERHLDMQPLKPGQITDIAGLAMAEKPEPAPAAQASEPPAVRPQTPAAKPKPAPERLAAKMAPIKPAQIAPAQIAKAKARPAAPMVAAAVLPESPAPTTASWRPVPTAHPVAQLAASGDVLVIRSKALMDQDPNASGGASR